MKEIIEKISSYNLFNYFFPGIIFAVLAEKFTGFSLLQENIVEGFFIYYFIGLVISRFGSLMIEPIIKYIFKIKFADYHDYINACEIDNKLELFSEINNMYRTLIATVVCLMILKGYEAIQISLVPELKNWTMYFLIVFLFLLFSFAYKKHSNYLVKRINKANIEKNSTK